MLHAFPTARKLAAALQSSQPEAATATPHTAPLSSSAVPAPSIRQMQITAPDGLLAHGISISDQAEILKLQLPLHDHNASHMARSCATDDSGEESGVEEEVWRQQAKADLARYVVITPCFHHSSCCCGVHPQSTTQLSCCCMVYLCKQVREL